MTLFSKYNLHIDDFVKQIIDELSKYDFDDIDVEIKKNNYTDNNFFLYFKKRIKFAEWIDSVFCMEIYPILYADRVEPKYQVRIEEHENGKTIIRQWIFEQYELVNFVVDKICNLSDKGEQAKISLLKGILS